MTLASPSWGWIPVSGEGMTGEGLLDAGMNNAAWVSTGSALAAPTEGDEFPIGVGDDGGGRVWMGDE